MRKYFLLFLLFPILITSCSTRNANVTKSFLNAEYHLWRAGDLHGLNPTSNEVLDRNPGFTNYIQLFDRKESFVNFQCKGTSYEDFYCDASFRLVDKNHNVLVNKDSFICEYVGGQYGMVTIKNDETKEYLGKIYVYTPYWCRWQYEYDVDGKGNVILLTFEFWIEKYNQLPDFLKNEN